MILDKVTNRDLLSLGIAKLFQPIILGHNKYVRRINTYLNHVICAYYTNHIDIIFNNIVHPIVYNNQMYFAINILKISRLACRTINFFCPIFDYFCLINKPYSNSNVPFIQKPGNNCCCMLCNFVTPDTNCQCVHYTFVDTNNKKCLIRQCFTKKQILRCCGNCGGDHHEPLLF